MRRFLSFRFVFALLAAFAVGSAVAVAAQVAANSYVKAGGYYGRSDGLYQDTTSKGLWAIGNGQPGAPVGATYYENFAKYGAGKGITCMDIGDASTCSGDLTTVAERLYLGDGLVLTAFPIATATINPVMTAVGLDITGDLTNDEGYEVDGGWWGASGRPFVIGLDPAFRFCVTATIADVDGTDEFMVGFRKLAPFTAAMQDYTDYAAIGDVSGNITTETELNSGGTTSTDTTNDWADAASHKVCVVVSGAGVVTYLLDDAAPTTTVGFTFDSGDQVIPFVYLRHDANVAETTAISKWEVSYP